VDTDTRFPYRGEQVCELRIDVAVWPEALDADPGFAANNPFTRHKK
jgi:hypothetical protein